MRKFEFVFIIHTSLRPAVRFLTLIIAASLIVSSIHAASPVVSVNQISSRLPSDTPCGILESGTVVACASKDSGINIYESLWDASLTLISSTTSFQFPSVVKSVVGIHRNFVLVLTVGDGLYLGTNVVLAISPQSIKRAAQSSSYFCVFYTASISYVTEHKLSPNTFLQAGSLVGWFSAQTMTTDAVYVISYYNWNVQKYTFTTNLAGRITWTSAAISIQFQVEQPQPYLGRDPFFLIRERGTPGSGGVRELFLWDNPLVAAECSTAGCAQAPGWNPLGAWVALTDSYQNAYCYGSAIISGYTDSVCAEYDSGTQVFHPYYCGMNYEYPSKFSVNASQPWMRKAPYFNLTNVTTSSLWDIPSGTYTIPNLGFSVPTFISQGVTKSLVDVAVIGGNTLVISLLRTGEDCSASDSRTVIVGGGSICDAEFKIQKTEALLLAIDLSVPDASLHDVRRVMSSKGAGTSLPPNSPQIITFVGPNGSSIVTSTPYQSTSISPQTSAVSAGTTAQYFSNFYSSYALQDVFVTETMITTVAVSGLVTLFKVPVRIGNTNYYYTTMPMNRAFNATNNLANCNVPVTFGLFVVDTGAGNIDGQIYPTNTASVVGFSPPVLDQLIASTTGGGIAVTFFTPPCSAVFPQVIRASVSGVPFNITFQMIPLGSPLTNVSSPPPPTQQPQVARHSHSATVTTTVTMTDATTETVSAFRLSESSTRSLEVLTESLTDVLSATRTLSQTSSQEVASSTLMMITPEPTVPHTVFPELPVNITTFTPVNATSLNPYPQDEMTAVMSLRAEGVSVFVIRVSLPFLGVGRLFTSKEPSVAFGSAVVRTDNGETQLMLRTVNMTEALLFLRTLCLAVNPDVVRRNLTVVVPVNITVWGETSSSVEATSLQSWRLPISALPLDEGPKLSPSLNCTLNVVRGVRFEKSIGSVFVHPLNLSVDVGTPIAGSLALPGSIRADCNASSVCVLKGVATDDAVIRFAITGSDGYFAQIAYCSITPHYAALTVVRHEPFVFTVKANSPFVAVLPSDIFLSSLPLTVLGVTLQSGFPLPSEITFTAPNTIQGVLQRIGILALRVAAVDLYNEATFDFVINVTDQAPVVVGSFNPLSIRAGTSFAYSIFVQSAVIDPDPMDSVSCILNVTLVVLPWVSLANVAVGVILVSGNAPSGKSFPHDRNVSLRLTCSDGTLTTDADIMLVMQRSLFPRLVTPLPNVSLIVSDTLQQTVSVNDYLVDDSGGPLSLGAVVTTGSLVNWVQVQRQSDIVVQFGGVPIIDFTGTFSIDLEVISVFGNATKVQIWVSVSATTWQLILQYSALIYSLLGLVASAITLWFYWVPAVNTITFPWKRVDCPFFNAAQFTLDDTGSSYSVHPSAVRAIAYVPFRKEVVKGRFRSTLRKLSCVSQYWRLLVTHDAKELPRWLLWRGDERILFCPLEQAQDRTSRCVVVELNEYDVIVRHYRCDFDEICQYLGQDSVPLNIAADRDDINFLLSTAGMTEDKHHTASVMGNSVISKDVQATFSKVCELDVTMKSILARLDSDKEKPQGSTRTSSSAIILQHSDASSDVTYVRTMDPLAELNFALDAALSRTTRK